MSNDEPKGSYVRWQSITINHLTYATNLVLTLAVAALGFQVNILLGEKYNPTSCGRCAFALALCLLVASVGLGLWGVIKRLRDFRLTASVARRRENMEAEKKAKEEIDRVLESDRVVFRKLGDRTWLILWWQVGTFSGGVLFAMIAVLALVGAKLL